MASPDAAAAEAASVTTAEPRRPRTAATAVTLRGLFLASIAVLVLAMCLGPAEGQRHRDPTDDKIPNKE